MARPVDEQALEVEVVIDGIGARGDGLATAAGHRLYVPLAAPGDRLRVRTGIRRGDGLEAEIIERLADGPARATPPCRHFGTCGGCQVQHLAPAAYLGWKRQLVVDAFGHQGLTPEVAMPLAMAPGTRRRAKLVAEMREGRIVLGFNARRSRRVVDIDACPLLVPALARRLAAVRSALVALLADGRRIELQFLALGDAVELLLVGGGSLDRRRKALLERLAVEADLARLAWRAAAEAPIAIISERAVFAADFAGVRVELPPGAFLQACLDAETAMRDQVVAALGRTKRIVDLYAGCGSFAAPLAKGRSVQAVERDEAASRALDAASRARADLRLTVERRDLEARPLLPIELAEIDAVVIDPPRGGAAPQAKQLARSEVPLIVAVSCNPATLARDARLLVDGGYRLEQVQPIDQFLWSAHVEAVAVFRRPRRGI